MGFCSLPPDRVKLAVNRKKKQTTVSKWAKGQDGLLLFTPWKSQNVLLLLTNWKARKKQRVGSNFSKRSQVGPGPFWLGDDRITGVKLGLGQVGPGPFWLGVKSGQGVKVGRNMDFIWHKIGVARGVGWGERHYSSRTQINAGGQNGATIRVTSQAITEVRPAALGQMWHPPGNHK